MRVHDVTQGSLQWLQLRAGIPTASAFDRIVTPKKGEASKQQEKYKFRLLAERMLGTAIDEKFTWSMERGSILESKAVQYYEFQRDLETVPAGFVTNDAESWGASPDRFVGEVGLLECKCPELETHMMYLMHEGSAYEDYKVQCQGQLWVCEGRQWVDVLSYYPGLPWALTRIERDEVFIKALEREVPKFSTDLEELCELAKQKGWLKPHATNPRADKPRGQTVTELMRETLGQMNRETTSAF